MKAKGVKRRDPSLEQKRAGDDLNAAGVGMAAWRRNSAARLGLSRRIDAFFHGKVAALAALLVVLLAQSGCVTSTAPLLTGAKAELGAEGQIHTFGLRPGKEKEPEGIDDMGPATFQWSGNRYLLRGNDRLPFSAFTVHPFEGKDRLLQILTKDGGEVLYFVARPIMQGAYALIPLIARDDAARKKLCPTDPAICHFTAPEQVYDLARAAARDPGAMPIAVVLLVRPPSP